MKIIKPGTLPSQTVAFTCQKCGCQFEAAKELEAVFVPDQRDGSYWRCVCPTPNCGRECTTCARKAA